ncbi:MAG: UDP-3-O-(3-hydroxymyristoyl)glucosamine N-acyltransferase [Bacteroidales bacterium]|nr:UDP-3-O-(3-hydroxymyristoyl)glucosamine N-acyltransferase [Bacteroidales bacterium]
MEILIMKMTAKELAEALHGTVEGNPDAVVSSFGKIEHGRPGQLNFFANPKYARYVYTTRASVLLVNRDFVPEKPLDVTLVRVDDAYSALAELLNYIASQRKAFRRHRGRCRIACSARLGSKVWVGDYVTVGRRTRIGDKTRICDNVTIGENVTIGSRCIIYPGVHVFANTVIGDNVILHAGCVIGDDGFGNARQDDGSWKKIEHLGNVVIGNDVEIGSNTTIDKAPMESTVIGNGVRIDNLCQIAHNVQIGDNTVMAAQTGIAGSAIIGRNCIIAGQVGIVGHVRIADNTTIGAKSGVIGNVRKSGEVLFGIPALDRTQYLRAFAKFKASAEE